MKNIIMVDLDTDREQQVKISKPDNMVSDLSDKNTAKEMVLADITTLCNAIGTLMQVGESEGYFEAKDLAGLTVKYFNDNFITNISDEEE